MDQKQLTTVKEEQLRCPKCGKEHTLPKYTVINVTEKPELKEKVLKNQLFAFKCSNCDLNAPMTYDSVYVDRNRKLVLAMSIEENEARQEELAQWKKSGYTLRIVDNINDLKEKIMIADNLLDDRIIELTKLAYLKQLEKEMADDVLYDILFDYSGNELFFIVFFEKKGIGRMPLNIENYRGVEQAFGSRARQESVNDFMKIDMAWASKIMAPAANGKRILPS